MKRERMTVRSKVLALAAAAVAVGMTVQQTPTAKAANVTWTGGTNGTSSPWLTATNWSTGSVPTATDVAEFETNNGTGTIGTTPGSPIGINLNSASTNNGPANQAIGEILLGPNSPNRFIGDSSPGRSGTLTINGVSGMLLDNQAVGKSLTLLGTATGTSVMTTAFAVAGNVNVTDAASSIVLTGPVTAAGSITKTGAGTLTMSGNTTFTSGGVNVTAGSFFFNNPATSGSSTLTGTVTTVAGTTFGGTGTVSGAVSSSGLLLPGGAGTVGTLTTGALTLNSGSAITFDFGAAAQDELFATGGLSLTGGTTVNLNNLGGVANGTFNLIDFTGGTFSGNVNQFSVGTAPSGPTYQFQLSGSVLQLVVSGAVGNLTWAGSISGAWDVNSTANWTGSATKFNNGDLVTFSDAGTNTNVPVAAGGVLPGSASFENNGKDYTVGGGAIGGTASLAKTGTGTLTLNAANTYTGPTTVSAGTLVLGTQGAVGGTSQVALSGGATLRFGSAQTLDRPLSVTGTGASIDTQGFTVTYSGSSSGAGAVTKAGTGTLVLSGTGGTTGTGAIALTAGKISVTAVNPANGVAGLGSGAVTLAGGTTYEVVGATVGFKSDGTTGNGTTINVGDGATLQGVTTGTAAPYAAVTGTIAFPASPAAGPAAGPAAVGHLAAPNAGDKFVIGSAVRNFGTQATNSGVISVEGNGVVQLASGGTSSTSNSQYNGSWLVNMGATGVLSVGPVLNGGFGEALNALGYDEPASGSGAYNGVTRPVTVSGGTLAIGADQANKSGFTPPAMATLRSPVTLDGGNLASTGYDYESFDTNAGSTLSTTQAVTGGLSAGLTLSANKTSKVLLYDPVAGTGAGSRSFNITSDPYLLPGVVPGAVQWGAGSTLAVDAGGTSGGVLTFSRNFDATNNPVTVGAGAKLSIGSGATVTLTSGGNNGDVGQDSLYDGTNAVSVANSGTLNVTSINTVILMDGPSGFPLTYQTPGVKHVGAITGGGTTNVKDGETLAIVAGSATSIQSAVNVDGSSLLDLNNNKLAINYAGSTVADAVRGQLQSGRGGSGAWDGTTGITTTTGKNDASQVTAIGYAEASQVVGVGGGTWAGVGVDGSTLLLKYTYYGDANLDGKVDGSDFTLLDKGFNKHVANAHWTDGDFNYDGSVTTADYLLADTAFGHQSGGVLSPEFLAQRQSQFGDAYVAELVAAVPEPTSLGLVGVAAAGLLGRRRRSAK